MTVRMALNRLTRRGPCRTAGEEILDAASTDGTSPLEAMVDAEQRAQLWDGLDRLKPVDRATLVAFYIRGD